VSENNFEQWAIVELFGHARLAGLVTEQTIGGNSFVRVDVPAVGGNAEFTKLYGQGAIYAMSFVDRDVALAAAERLDEKPVSVYGLADVNAEAVKNRLRIANQRNMDFDDDEFPV